MKITEYETIVKSVDTSNPQEIINAIKNFIENPEMLAEQKLFGIGYLLNKNKEEYINNLRSKITNQASIIHNLQNQIAHYKNAEEKEILRKKVIVIKRKPA